MRLVPARAAVKLVPTVGRTSAPLISGLDDTIARLTAYEAAGVDALGLAYLVAEAQ